MLSPNLGQHCRRIGLNEWFVLSPPLSSTWCSYGAYICEVYVSHGSGSQLKHVMNARFFSFDCFYLLCENVCEHERTFTKADSIHPARSYLPKTNSFEQFDLRHLIIEPYCKTCVGEWKLDGARVGSGIDDRVSQFTSNHSDTTSRCFQNSFDARLFTNMHS